MARTLMGKTRDAEHPYLVFQSADGWTWKVLKGYQGDDAKAYARWFCDVESPYTFGGSDLGDTYVADVVRYGRLTYIDPVLSEAGYTPPSADSVQAPHLF